MATPTLPPWRDLDTLATAWRDMARARDLQVRRLIPGFKDPAEGFWNARAADFRAMLTYTGPDAFRDRLAALVRPTDTVLDVGAGAGRYAFPIAPSVRSIVAVEPAAAMRQALEEEAASRHVTNITTVAADWEDAAVDPADVVVCSHALYSTPDIADFLRKLIDHARRTVVIAVRIDQFDAHTRDCFAGLWGESRLPEPTFVELTPMLYALGAAPNVEVTEFAAGRAFADMEEAQTRIAAQVYATPTHADAVRAYARARLRRADDGTYAWAALPIRSAIAWWEKPAD